MLKKGWIRASLLNQLSWKCLYFTLSQTTTILIHRLFIVSESGCSTISNVEDEYSLGRIRLIVNLHTRIIFLLVTWNKRHIYCKAGGDIDFQLWLCCSTRLKSRSRVLCYSILYTSTHVSETPRYVPLMTKTTPNVLPPSQGIRRCRFACFFFDQNLL
jgi:hypothetical protein